MPLSQRERERERDDPEIISSYEVTTLQEKKKVKLSP
jgi:hypothetical protein